MADNNNVHSLGPTCVYYEDDLEDGLNEGSTPPKVKAQFFYVSSLPIDDPLSPLPPLPPSDKTSTTRAPLQPFSARDNAALEEAWQAFQKGEDPQKAQDSRPQPKMTKAMRDMSALPKSSRGSTSQQSPKELSSSSPEINDGGELARATTTHRNVILNTYNKLEQLPEPQMKQDAISSASKKGPSGASERDSNPRESEETRVMLSQGSEGDQDSSEPVNAKELGVYEPEPRSKRRRQFSPFRYRDWAKRSSRETSPEPLAISADSENSAKITRATGPSAGSDISGNPFARSPSHRKILNDIVDGVGDTELTSDGSEEFGGSSRSHSGNVTRPTIKEKKAFVPVGVSRLHLVEIPDLVMKPIYWNPINDKSSVTRATWFYKASMMPVPAEVANRLETGYEYMKPYVDTYQEELNACVENGAAAELKVVQKLWPDDQQSSRPNTAVDQKTENTEMKDEQANDSAGLETQENAAADPRKVSRGKMFGSYSVVYVNSTDAQILKPSLLPSESRGRKPLGPIRRGREIGIAVVRGFDRKAWQKLHPDPKMDAKAAYAKVGAYMSQSGDATTRNRRMSCSACKMEEKTPKVSDLVLVIHGIGQKLSERVDSFHFTHAINGFRREVNVELSTEAVKGNLRPNTGIMVLPINWRLTLSFDEESKPAIASAENSYHLKDITPDTLPAVRSLISDVMLDIPYYLSHHKQKMTSAVIKEANRVYRLWCRNNPGFHEYGRVHLIAHSLGSAMAMDILSQQPTTLPKGFDLASGKASDKLFEFNTTNLFCCGSPSGFFLLLNGANLIPRKGRNKAGMDGEDKAPGIAGDAGTYGCLAVDNIYNICHRNDPIAYQQNACVDRDYAASLTAAFIPSVSPGFFARVGSSFRWTSSSTSAAYGTVVGTNRPTMQHMPSTVEMETHDFTREEIAEKRMYLLNDNGQIDFFLNSGGGPLEIQYLNMLSAHSSYWLLQDFVRFLVVEIGREPGKDGTLPVLRARKKREYKRGTIA